MKATKTVKANATKTATVNAKAATVAQNAGQNAANATETAKAVSLTLDFKSNHAIRVKASLQKIDLWALHAVKRCSRGYCAAVLAAVDSLVKESAGKGASHVMTVNGVANTVTLLSAGFYARGHEGSQVFGNVEMLNKLYGKLFGIFGIAELAGKFASLKGERVKKGKRVFDDARVFAKRVENQDCAFIVKDGDKFFVHNGEHGRNVHNGGERIVTLAQAKVATATEQSDKLATIAQKLAEKLAAQG